MAHKILVVDDEENMRALLKRVLGKAGYDVECADSGKTALRLALDKPFDLAVVDVRMPEMGGIEALAGFKVIAGEMPVIMISASPSWEGRQVAASLGCAEYLSKPLDMKRLKEIIKKELKGS
ncbi:MAG: response regulator [Pseudomonadota bacterium]